MLVVGTNKGRVGRARRKDMSNLVYDVLKARKGEEITTTRTFRRGGFLLAVSARGSVMAFDPNLILADGPAASRGRTLYRNFFITDFLPLDKTKGRVQSYLTSHGRVIELKLPDELPTPKQTKPQKVLQLDPDERLLLRL